MTPPTSESGAAWWVLPLVLAAVPLFWLSVVVLIARLGGWAGLAKAFPAAGQPRGRTFRGLSLQIPPATSYGGCVTAVFSPDGLHLVPFWLFRFGHPALLIPWENVGAPAEQKVLWMKFVHLPIAGKNRSARLGLSRMAREWLQGTGSKDEWRPSLSPAIAAAALPALRRPSAWRGR